MGRTVCLDAGTVRVGVAISDSAGTMAFPRPALLVGSEFIPTLRKLVEEEGVARIVIGLPLMLNGNTSASVTMSDRLCAEIALEFPEIAIERVDERLSTVQAQQALRVAGKNARKQKEIIDSASAVIILQHFLESQPNA